MPEYNYDRFGYCVICSKQVIVIETINGKQQARKLPDWAESEVKLTDGSQMRICVCKDCKPKVSDNLDFIWGKVYRGWEHDIIEKGWDEDKKEAYLNRYGALSIVGVL